MGKIKKTAESAMLLDIEFADNGIIIRDPIDPDCITIATYQDTHHNGVLDKDIEFADIYTKLGRILYTWLCEVVIGEHEKELYTTGFKLVFHASCVGRKKDS